MAGPPSVAPEPVLNKARHINYWLRCLKTLLPTDYTSNDSNRMTLGFFIISALDVLGVLETHTKPEERREYIDWIYHCQHPEGGFRGFPATDFGARRTAANAQWDPANLPATFFALATLIVLGDDLTRVRTRQCLAWLPTLQREEGSLGEMLGEGARIEGKRDMRFCYSAAAVRWILRGPRAETVADVPDLDVDAMVRFINASETYEHGFAEGPYREAHAGLTYCAVGTLSLLDRLASASLPASPPATESTTVGLTDPESTIRWLLSRQIIQADDEGDESEDEEADNVPTDVPDLLHHADGVGCFPADFTAAGFNGRCNKDADTCYAFWVSGSMAVGIRLLMDVEARIKASMLTSSLRS
ncbi:MAG: hypothetical protein M1838_004458 [Thelocarpon superellum]|nr:MAG: hypothetical protein M1838_004458 [Thelocarpon superellum]